MAIRQQTFPCFSLGSYLKQGRMLVTNTLEKFSFNPWHINTLPLPCQKHKINKQFILIEHWNILLGKAIPTTMIVCMPKVGFSLKSLVLVAKSKLKLSDFSGEPKSKCVELLCSTADVVWPAGSIVCWEVTEKVGCISSPWSQQAKRWLVEQVW